jgi:hypothetical protein
MTLPIQNIEIMVNDCFGGFGFSKQASEEYVKRSRNLPVAKVDCDTIPLLLPQSANTSKQSQQQTSGGDLDHNEEPNFRAINAYNIKRHDPLMIQIVKELGEKANGFCAQISIETIPSQYINHYSIEDYDGSERVVIHYNKYKVDSAKDLLRNPTLTNFEKIARISALLHAPLKEQHEAVTF